MKISRIISYLVILIIVILAISFAASNAATVPLHYYLGTANVSLSLLLVYALGIGIALGFLANLFAYFRLKSENRSLRQQIKRIEKEKELAAKNMPIQEISTVK